MAGGLACPKGTPACAAARPGGGGGGPCMAAAGPEKTGACSLPRAGDSGRHTSHDRSHRSRHLGTGESR